jgi:hypothetical protein
VFFHLFADVLGVDNVHAVFLLAFAFMRCMSNCLVRGRRARLLNGRSVVVFHDDCCLYVDDLSEGVEDKYADA